MQSDAQRRSWQLTASHQGNEYRMVSIAINNYSPNGISRKAAERDQHKRQAEDATALHPSVNQHQYHIEHQDHPVINIESLG